MQKIKDFFLTFRQSLINPQFYQGVRKESFWVALRYFYVLLAIVGFTYSLSFALSLATLIPQAPKIKENIKIQAEKAYPDNLKINIDKGQLSTNVTQPYYYYWSSPSAQKAIAVIDTNASVEDYQKYKDTADILITKTAVVYPKNATQTEVFFLSDLSQNITLDKATYLKGVSQLEPYLNNLVPLITAGIIFILVFGTFIGAALMLGEKLFSLLFFSSLVFLMTKILRKNLGYGEAYKISMHASTLPILFFSLLGLFGLTPAIPFGYSLLLSLVVAVILHRLWTKTS